MNKVKQFFGTAITSLFRLPEERDRIPLLIIVAVAFLLLGLLVGCSSESENTAVDQAPAASEAVYYDGVPSGDGIHVTETLTYEEAVARLDSLRGKTDKESRMRYSYLAAQLYHGR